MLALWPGLFIQASMTAAGSDWPRAMFSPPRLVIPACAARSHGVAPLGSVWSKKPWSAMAWLKAPARSASALLAATGLQPTFARSALTSLSTSAAAAASVETSTGAVVSFFAGFFSFWEGVVFGFLLGGAAGFFVGFSAGAGVEVEAEVEGAGDGEEARSASRLVELPSSRLSALPEVPPCSAGELVGEPAACTSPPVVLPPPSL